MNDDQLLTKPVVVLGAPRSGTSALGEMLHVHSAVGLVLEPRLTWRYGNDRKSDMLRPADATPAVVRHIRKQFANQVRQAGGERLLEKTPSNSLRIGFVERVFPDCKVIHIIRNGIDSSLSILSFWNQAAYGLSGINKGILSQRVKEMQISQFPHYVSEAVRRFSPRALHGVFGRNIWGPRLPGMREMLKELEIIEICALQWRICVEAACQYGSTMPSDRYREVRLEALNLEVFRELLEFAELKEQPEVIRNFEQSFDPRLCGRRRPGASAEDIESVLRWIRPTMHWLGYPV